MELTLFQRIYQGLTDKRENLRSWLREASAEEKTQRLASAGEKGVKGHLQVIETALRKAEDRTLGLCEVCGDYVDAPLLEMDYTACVCLSHLSAQEQHELEMELEFTRDVQRALLPQQLPMIPGVEIAAYSRPARIVGGDFFDFLEFADGKPGITIADVMGHGMSAGMIVSSLQTALRTLVPLSHSLDEVLGRVNRFYLHNLHFNTFVTAFLMRLDVEEKTLEYCNAGHNPPVLFRARSGELEWLKPTGAALALVEEYRHIPARTSVATGDTLLLYTDGVTEAANSSGEEFGRTRLAAHLQQNAYLPAGDYVRSLRETLAAFTGGRPFEDDTTLIVCKTMA